MGKLRFILAISVVLTHSSALLGLKFVPGQLAVQAFYIISGFYMALILNEKYINEKGHYKLFITNRLLRLYPIYWAVLILAVLLFLFSGGTGTYWQYLKSMRLDTSVFLIFSNIFLLFQDAIMFLGLDVTKGTLFFTTNFHNTSPMLYTFLFVPQAWTIGLEMAFYLIAPFIVTKKNWVLISVIALSFALRVILIKSGLKADPWSYRFFPTEIAFFLLGAVGYRIYTKARNINIPSLYSKILLGVVLCYTIFYEQIPLPIPVKYWSYLVLIFASVPFLFILSKTWKYDRYLGELSYPIYISHMLVITCFLQLKLPTFGSLGLTVTICTLIMAILLNELIGKRIEKIRQRRVSNAQRVPVKKELVLE